MTWEGRRGVCFCLRKKQTVGSLVCVDRKCRCVLWFLSLNLYILRQKKRKLTETVLVLLQPSAQRWGRNETLSSASVFVITMFYFFVMLLAVSHVSLFLSFFFLLFSFRLFSWSYINLGKSAALVLPFVVSSVFASFICFPPQIIFFAGAVSFLLSFSSISSCFVQRQTAPASSFLSFFLLTWNLLKPLEPFHLNDAALYFIRFCFISRESDEWVFISCTNCVWSLGFHGDGELEKQLGGLAKC